MALPAACERLLLVDHRPAQAHFYLMSAFEHREGIGVAIKLGGVSHSEPIDKQNRAGSGTLDDQGWWGGPCFHARLRQRAGRKQRHKHHKAKCFHGYYSFSAM